MTMSQPTPYTDLNTVLANLVSKVRGALGDTFVGAYLEGSLRLVISTSTATSTSSSRYGTICPTRGSPSSRRFTNACTTWAPSGRSISKARTLRWPCSVIASSAERRSGISTTGAGRSCARTTVTRCSSGRWSGRLRPRAGRPSGLRADARIRAAHHPRGGAHRRARRNSSRNRSALTGAPIH